MEDLRSTAPFMEGWRGMQLLLEEELSELLHGILGSFDGMSDSSVIGEDLIVISTFMSLITKEVNLLESFLLDVSESVCLVPASWEDVE